MLGLAWLLGVTVVGSALGMNWRDALAVAAASTVVALVVADIYVKHQS